MSKIKKAPAAALALIAGTAAVGAIGFASPASAEIGYDESVSGETSAAVASLNTCRLGGSQVYAWFKEAGHGEGLHLRGYAYGGVELWDTAEDYTQPGYVDLKQGTAGYLTNWTGDKYVGDGNASDVTKGTRFVVMVGASGEESKPLPCTGAYMNGMAAPDGTTVGDPWTYPEKCFVWVDTFSVTTPIKHELDNTDFRGYDANGKLVFDTGADWSKNGPYADNYGSHTFQTSWKARDADRYGEEGGVTRAALADAVQNGKIVATYSGVESKPLDCYVQGSPIAVDLDDSGAIELAGDEARFDLDGDGDRDQLTNWFGARDGILVDARVAGASGANLFGDEGGRYADGFEKLSGRDTDGNSVVSGRELAGLALWVDADGDARRDAGETRSLASAGITELSTEHVGMVSSATTRDGGSVHVEDIWFDVVG